MFLATCTKIYHCLRDKGAPLIDKDQLHTCIRDSGLLVVLVSISVRLCSCLTISVKLHTLSVGLCADTPGHTVLLGDWGLDGHTPQAALAPGGEGDIWSLGVDTGTDLLDVGRPQL